MNQLAFGTTSAGDKFLLAGNGGGLLRVNLAPPAAGKPYAVTSPALSGQDILGVTTLPSTTAGGGTEIVVSAATQSRVYHFDSLFNLIEIFGRPVYRASEPIATQAMIGQPEGLTQDPTTGNIYFFDSINDVIRNVSSTGSVNLVAGSPGVAKSQWYAAKSSLSTAKFSGSGRFLNGGQYNLTGQFAADGSSKNLYFGEGISGFIHAIDLVAGQLHTIGGPSTALTSAQEDLTPTSWFVGGLALLPNSSELFINRYYPFNGLSTFEETGELTEMNVTAPSEQPILGDTSIRVPQYFTTASVHVPSGTLPAQVPIEDSRTLRIDSKGNMFFSSYGFYMTQLVNNKPGPVLNIKINNSNRISLGTFEMVEDGTDRLIFYPNGEALDYIRIPLATITSMTTPVAVTTQAVCLPGTFLKQVDGMALSADGNLLLSDSSNGRILEYFIRDDKGKIVLNSCP